MQRNIRDTLARPSYNYYNFQYVNSSDQNVVAQKSDTTLIELFKNPDNYLVNIQRFEIDTRGLPLTNNNIPFEQWQISLGYNASFVGGKKKLSSAGKLVGKKRKAKKLFKTTTEDGWTYVTATVPQYNPRVQLDADYILSNGNVTAYSTVTGTQIGTIAINDAFALCSSSSYLFVLSPTVVTVLDYEFNIVNTVTFADPDPINIVYSTGDNFILGYSSTAALYVFTAGLPPTWVKSTVYTTVSSYYLKAMACNGISLFAADEAGYVYEWEVSLGGNPYKTELFTDYRYDLLSCGTGSQLCGYGVNVTAYGNILGVAATGGAVDVIIPSEASFAPGNILSSAILVGSYASGYCYGIRTGAAISTCPITSGVGTTWTTVAYGISVPVNLGATYVENSNLGTVICFDGSTNNIYLLDIWIAAGGVSRGEKSILTNIAGGDVNALDMNDENKLVYVNASDEILISSAPMMMMNFAFSSGVNGYNYNFDGSFTSVSGVIVSTIPSGAIYPTLVCDGTNYYWSDSLATTIYVTSMSGSLVTSFATGLLLAGLDCAISEDILLAYGAAVDGGLATINIYSKDGTLLSTLVADGLLFGATMINSTVMAYLNTDPKVFVYDLSDPTTPTLISEFDVGAGILLTANFIRGIDSGYGKFMITGSTEAAIYTFTSNTYEDISADATVPVITTGTGAKMLFAVPTASCFVMYRNSGQAMYYPISDTVTVSSTLPTSNVGQFCVVPYIPFTYSPVTSNKPISSISCDRASTLLYGCDGSNVFIGNYSSGVVDFHSITTTETYNQVSSIITPVSSSSVENLDWVKQKNGKRIGVANRFLATIDVSSLDQTGSSSIASSTSLLYGVSGSTMLVSFTPGVISSYEISSGVGLSKTYSGVIVGYTNKLAGSIPNVPYPIYQYQEFLDQINATISSVHSELIALDIGFTETNVPLIYFDPSTNLFKIVAADTYASDNVALDFNSTLWNRFLFQSVLDTNNTATTVDSLPWREISFIDFGTNAGLLTMPSLSVLALWTDVTTIIVQSERMPILGDTSGNNQIINQVTDVAPDFASITPGEPIIYIPTTLRQYNIKSAGQPFNQMSIGFAYSTKDGSIYPLELIPGGYFSIKLQFSYIGVG